MNLKNAFKRIGGNRLNEAPKFSDYLQDKSAARAGRAGTKEHPSGFDYPYFIAQVEGLVETLEAFEEEIGTQLEMKADETGESYWKQAENQTSRYIMGAHKQLDALKKKLQTGESRVGPGMYKM